MLTQAYSAACRTACILLIAFSASASEGELAPVPTPAQASLRLPDDTGRQRSLDEFRGRLVLVHFWASWCAPCQQELPGLSRLAADLDPDRFVLIGVNVAEQPLRARTAASRLGFRPLLLFDDDGSRLRAWGDPILPSSYLVDARGVISHAAHGPLDWDRPDIRRLLQTRITAP